MQSIACCGIASASTLSVNRIREGGVVLRHSIQASCSLPSVMKCCRARDSPQKAHLIGGGCGRGAGGRGDREVVVGGGAVAQSRLHQQTVPDLVRWD